MPSTPVAASRRLIPWLAAIAVAAVLAAWLWPRSASEAHAEDAGTNEARVEEGRLGLTADHLAALGIETVEATAATTLPLAGLAAEAIAPIEGSARVAVPYAGVVTRVLADEGSDVKHDQPLVRIQSRDWLRAEAEFAQARGEAEAARQQARRDDQLLAEGIIATSRREESRARALAAEGQLRHAQGAASGLRGVRDGVPGEYELLAPIDARVLHRAVTPGQSVAALDEAFALATVDALDVLFTVPVGLRDSLATGLHVDLPGGLGEVVAVAGSTDAATQRLRVRARTEGRTGLVPGQHFTLTLQLPAPEGAVAIPARALLPKGERAIVYVRDAGGDAATTWFRAVDVQRVGGDDTTAVVTGPLGAGQHVVARGASALKPLLSAE